jgi:spore germination cell wall hydrolase CwlJ-like protein
MLRVLLAILLAIVCSPLASPQKVRYTSDPKPKAYQCLAWVVHDESRGEPLRGSRAVLDAVLKRMKDSGKAACEVIAEPSQFSGFYPEAPYDVSKEALQRFVAVAKMKPVTVECKYFHAVYVHPAWANKMTKCFQVGKHIFYKEKKHASRKPRRR